MRFNANMTLNFRQVKTKYQHSSGDEIAPKSMLVFEIKWQFWKPDQQPVLAHNYMSKPNTCNCHG